MSLKTNPLRNAIVIALAASCTTPAFAQSAGDTPTNLDRIEITGSRIRQASVETAQPVVALSRAEIEKKGYINVADILQDVTAAGAPSLSRSSSLSSSRDFGGTYVSLRNLGPERSLVLIDSRRMGVSAGGYSDLASIPSAIVERVEVLTDGASALYGSDAIAGVVNIITRKNFDGGEASVYVGQYGEGDGQKRSYSATFGKTFDRGWFSVGAERTKEDEILGSEREFSRYPGGPRHPDDVKALNQTTQWGSVTVDGKSLTVGPGGDPSQKGNFHTPNPADGANTKTNMSLLSGLERTSVFANGGFSITDDLRIVADALYSKRESTKHLAGYPYSVSTAQARNGSRAALSKDSAFNHWGQDVLFSHRTEEMPRATENNLDTKRASIGLEGSFETGSRYWDWNVSYMYNRNEGERIGTGSMYQPHVDLAVGPSFMDGTVARCGSPGAVIAGCVPWNPAAPMGYAGPGSLSNQDVQDYLFTRFVDKMKSTTKVASANISGSVFTLPAGDVMAAMGFEHRNEEASYTPDLMVQKGQIAGTTGQPTRGDYSLNEVYLELQVPLLADMPFARELSLDLAGRYTDYNTFGSTTNSKFGLKWKPIDSLLVRATYGTGFRAPTVDDLYGGAVKSRDSFTDPCDTSFGIAASSATVAARCQALKVPADFRQQTASEGNVANRPGQQGIADFDSGSNANLKPETAKTWTVGLVYSPEFVPGLDVSLDWWKIRIDNAIVGESATDILNQCYVQGVDSACGRFTRSTSAKTLGQVTSLDRSLVNAGYRETAGYDFSLRYRLPETAFGRFAATWNTTYTDYLEQRNDSAATTPVEQKTGWQGNFRVRSTFNLDWQYGDLGIGWTARYYSGMKEACSYDLAGGPDCNMAGFVSPYTDAQPSRKVGSNTFHDLQVRYSLPWDGTVSLGVNNVFDHQGPIMYSQPNSSFTYYGGFDIGRFMYMKYQQRF
ncbi:TPA: TonB-dependent receptor [Stenotrophomonas maltophilia]|nr:TonB-dependent receptor [Stenotrophomonas maltophilia]HDS1623981.1 TonB-dependent receptor [Stenotrophomonas maltophilia]